MTIYSICGVIGVTIAASAYFLMQKGKIRNTDYSFLIAYIISSALNFVSLIGEWNLAFFLTELSYSYSTVRALVGKWRGDRR